MNLLHQSVPLILAVLGWTVTLPALASALWTLRGHAIAPQAANAWLGGAIAVALLWRLQDNVGNVVHLGMLGSAIYALTFGRARGFLGLLFALVAYTLFDAGAWINFGVNGILFALLPTLIATALQRMLGGRAPRNLFVFMIGNGFFVALAATVATSLALLGASLAGAPAAAFDNLGDYVGYALLLAWGEAIASGMLFSALVVFLPSIVLTYSAEDYGVR